MTQKRGEIINLLNSKPWFKASTPSIQMRLFGLPDYCDGFLDDLASRQDEGGGVRLINIDAVLIPDTNKIFGIFIAFRVQNLKNPSSVYWYQYFSWAQGPESGAKGLILIEQCGIITHLVLMRGFKFAIGADVFDCIGGFGEVNEKGVAGMLTRFQKEIQEELGIPDLKVKKVINLGRMYVDGGMTNNHPHLFAAVIDGNEATKLQEGESANPDQFEMRGNVMVVPISALWGENGLIAKNDDAFFGMCIARLLTQGKAGISLPHNDLATRNHMWLEGVKSFQIKLCVK